jgi:hypothetical protein
MTTTETPADEGYAHAQTLADRARHTDLVGDHLAAEDAMRACGRVQDADDMRIARVAAFRRVPNHGHPVVTLEPWPAADGVVFEHEPLLGRLIGAPACDTCHDALALVIAEHPLAMVELFARVQALLAPIVLKADAVVTELVCEIDQGHAWWAVFEGEYAMALRLLENAEHSDRVHAAHTAATVFTILSPDTDRTER